MTIRQAYASKNFTSTAALTVALLATFAACSVDTDGFEFVPDEEFNGSGAAGGTKNSGGSSNVGGENGEGGSGDSPSEACEPGERRCSDEGELQTCEEGTPPAWSTDEDCEAPGRCSVLRDKCLDCTPGEFRCNDAELQQCDMAGEKFEPVQTCIDAEACVASGQTGFCKVCEPGETTCEGELHIIPGDSDDNWAAVRQVRTCSANGAYTELNAACQGDNPVCNLEARSCGSCKPGTFSCQGTDLYECNGEGYLEYTDRCASVAACNAETGECDDAEIDCIPGQNPPQCTEEGLVQVCGWDGKWHNESCSGGESCYDGSCQPCDPATNYQCNSDTLSYCTYSPWNGVRTLWPYQTCESGTCSAGTGSCTTECAQGTVVCSAGSSTYYTCDANGNWVNPVQCPDGQFCNGSACVTCLPNQYRCDNQTLKQCTSDGSAETTVQNCALNNLNCNAEFGMCGPYGGGGSYFCNADGDFAYMNVNGQTSVEDYCDGQQCSEYSGCYGSVLCQDGSLACEGRNVRACDNGYYEDTDTSCSNANTCQPTLGCAIPISISAGYNHTCAVLASPDSPEQVGYAVCWGANDHGQLGNGTAPENGGFGDSIDPRRVIFNVKGEAATELEVNGYGLAAFSRVSAGRDFTCADVQNPENAGEYFVACWGSNEFGQLGADNPDPKPMNGPGVEDGISFVNAGNNALSLRHVTAGAQFACALDPGGAAWCWGKNDAGQLGIDASDEYLPYASEVEDGHNFVEIAAGARHVCAVESNGSVWCWGDNSFGQLGTGNGDSVKVPTQVGEIAVSGAEDAFPALGRDFSAVLAAEENSPLSWGANLFGQLGDGDTAGRNEPAAMSSVSSADALALFSSSTAQHQCLRDKDNHLLCVGANVFGQLGNKSTVDSTEFVEVWDGSDDAKTLSGVRDAVAVGGRHTCAINAKNEVWCWGANHRHQLGSTKATPQTAPSKIF